MFFAIDFFLPKMKGLRDLNLTNYLKRIRYSLSSFNPEKQKLGRSI